MIMTVAGTEAAEDIRSRRGGHAAEDSGREACSGDQSARSAEKFFRLNFSVIRMGSRGTFVLCTDVGGSMLQSSWRVFCSSSAMLSAMCATRATGAVICTTSRVNV